MVRIISKAATKQVGQFLRLLRLEQHWTQAHVAEKLGVNLVTVRRWELGLREPSEKSLDDLAGIYDIDADSLMSPIGGKMIDKANPSPGELDLVGEPPAARPDLLPALVDVDAAKLAWSNYLALKAAVLTDEDYLWSATWDEPWASGNRSGTNTRRQICPTKAAAVALAKEKSGRAEGKIVKSGCLKLGRFFELELPERERSGPASILEVGEWIVQTETGPGYAIVSWLDKQLETVKASVQLTVQDRAGHRQTANGGSHQNEGKSDFAVAEMAWTRALCRAIIGLVGMGDKIDADEDPVDTKTGEILTPPGQSANFIESTGNKTPATPATPAAEPAPEPADPTTLDELKKYVADNNRSWEAFEDAVNVQGDDMLGFTPFARVFDRLMADGTLPAIKPPQKPRE
jgi:transcriptional regulator with XRE-family HTH domain